MSGVVVLVVPGRLSQLILPVRLWPRPLMTWGAGGQSGNCGAVSASVCRHGARVALMSGFRLAAGRRASAMPRRRCSMW